MSVLEPPLIRDVDLSVHTDIDCGTHWESSVQVLVGSVESDGIVVLEGKCGVSFRGVGSAVDPIAEIHMYLTLSCARSSQFAHFRNFWWAKFRLITSSVLSHALGLKNRTFERCAMHSRLCTRKPEQEFSQHTWNIRTELSLALT